MSVTFGPGDQTILASGIADLYLWDVETGNYIRRYSGLSSVPYSVDISSDGKYVLAGSMDGEVILWDYANGEELRRINALQGVYSVVFSPDGRDAFAASIDGKLIQWHVAEKTLSELLDWIKANRYIRELTCAEKLQYQVDPQCNQ